MSCNIVINQQVSLPVSNKVTPEAKMKDPKRIEAARRGLENYMKKLKGIYTKSNRRDNT